MKSSEFSDLKQQLTISRLMTEHYRRLLVDTYAELRLLKFHLKGWPGWMVPDPKVLAVESKARGVDWLHGRGNKTRDELNNMCHIQVLENLDTPPSYCKKTPYIKGECYCCSQCCTCGG